MRAGKIIAALLFSATLPAAAVAQGSSYDAQRLNALLFAEIGYREREEIGDDGFYIGQGVGQVTYAFSDRLSAFTEMTLTSRKGESREFEFERLSMRYDFSDSYKLSVGRYHTPLGYWNAAYHHGSWLQTTVGRPNTMRFGSFIIPIHFQGALLEGNVGESPFSYRVGLGNARGEDINDTDDLNDTFSDPAVLFGASYRNPGRTRFEAGITAYVDEPENTNGVEVDETIVNAYFAFLDESPEVIIEYTYADHDARTGEGNVNSIYAQFAYRLDNGDSPFKPYIRVEDVDVDRSDPLIGQYNLDYSGYIAGLRWDFLPVAALKTEIRREKFGNADRRNGVWLQLSFVHRAAR